MAEMLAKIFDPRGWFSATNEVDQTLQRMAEGPRLADLWNVERKFMAVFNAWVAMRRHSLEHNTVMLEAWMKAAGAFAKTLNERAERGETLESSREVMALWVETANEILLEAQRSDAFLKTQRDLLKASTDLRLAQQELAEFYSEMFGYPTRTELDDVHKTVTELRRELRAFKRESRAPRPAPERADGAARKAPRRTAPAHPRSRSARGPPRQERRHERNQPSHPDQAGAGDRRSGRPRAEDRERRQAVRGDPRRGRGDRDDAQGRGLAAGQGHPLPLPARDGAKGLDPRPDRLWACGPLHHGGPAGGPLARP